MAPIKLKHIISFTSEDKNFPADNLIKTDSYRKWRCAESGEKQASVTVQLEKASNIYSIDIGNEGSAFIEVLVNRSDCKDPYQVLLVMSSFMSPTESTAGTNLNRVRMFGPNQLSQVVMKEKWDCIKIVCTQPFNKKIRYGISFIKLHSPPEKAEEVQSSTKQSTLQFGAFKMKDEETSDVLKPGGLFAKRKEKSFETPLTGAAAIRAASAAAEASILSKTPESTSGSSSSIQTSSISMPKQTNSKLKQSDSKFDSKFEDATSFSRHKQKEERIKASLKKHSSSVEETHGNNSSTQKQKPPPKKKVSKRERPFEKLMEGVVFTLSGYQNPYRSQLRDTALSMGAKYRPDWDSQCTHLICAFVNTPKYLQVQGENGKIVKKEWILDCNKQKKLISWKKYRMDGKSSADSEDTDEEMEADDEEEEQEEKESFAMSRKRAAPAKQAVAAKASRTSVKQSDSFGNNEKSSKAETNLPSRSPKASKKATPKKDETSGRKLMELSDDEVDRYSGSTEIGSNHSVKDFSSDTDDEIRRIQENEKGKKKTDADDDDIYDADTDIDDFSALETRPDTSQLALPTLPDFFTGKQFFLYGNFDDSKRRRIHRYIVAYNGKIEDYMNGKVSFVITESKWDDNFDEALSENSHLVFVRPQWIFACAKKGRTVTHKPFIVSPAAD